MSKRLDRKGKEEERDAQEASGISHLDDESRPSRYMATYLGTYQGRSREKSRSSPVPVQGRIESYVPSMRVWEDLRSLLPH